jgi:hypothetical protein
MSTRPTLVACSVAGLWAAIVGVYAWLAPLPAHASEESLKWGFETDGTDLPARRLEDLYAEATVVAQVLILGDTKSGPSVRPLAIFKTDGKPINDVIGPPIFCRATFTIGGIYLVFAERDSVHQDRVLVLDSRRGDEINTYMATSPGGRSARFIDRLEQISGVPGFGGRPERVAAGLPRTQGCAMTEPTTLNTQGD